VLYPLSTVDCLNISMLGYATTQYLVKGVDSMDQQANDPDFKKDKDWSILEEYIFSQIGLRTVRETRKNWPTRELYLTLTETCRMSPERTRRIRGRGKFYRSMETKISGP
jgi:hypothetical protein